MKIRICDYIAETLVKYGITRVYGVVAGGAAGIQDGWASNPNIQFIALHGEGSCGYAAVSDAKVTGNISVVNSGTGCCSTNVVTSVLTAWQDAVPVLFIAGNVNLNQTIDSSKAKIRTFGVQGADIISIISSITKYSVMVTNKNDIPFILGKAIYECLNGRPGPCFIDIPTDIQTAQIDPLTCLQFKPEDKDVIFDEYKNQNYLWVLWNLLSFCKRPVVMVGNGMREQKEQLDEFLKHLNCPCVTTYGANDIADEKYNIGVIGTKGNRAANFILHQSDVVIILGSSLSVSVTGYNYSLFAPNAKIILVDIDKTQHSKEGIKLEIFINKEGGSFLKSALSYFRECDSEFYNLGEKWLNKAKELKNKWPVCLPEYKNQGETINIYHFLDELYKRLKDDSVLVADAGGSFYSVCQTFKPKKNQKLCTDLANAAMGYCVPATIGASFAKNKGEIVGICGDGGFAFNMQELQSIVHHKLPIKLFIINNNGYNSLRKTQENFFKSRYIGTDPENGVSFPSLKKVADCFDIPYYGTSHRCAVEVIIEMVLKQNGPVLCEIVCSPDMSILPAIGSKIVDGKIQSMPLWNMSPFLSEEELNKELECIQKF